MPHRSIRPYGPSLLVAALLCASPALSPLAAQAPIQSDARLQGLVVDDATYQPVDSALVSVVGTDFSVATGRWGSFAFPDAPFGTVSISVSAPGHPTMVQDVEVKNGQVTYVEVVLPSVAATLRALLVRTGRPDAIRNAARSAADLLADKVPRTRANSGIVGKTDFVINLRGTSTLQGTEEPIILIDGVVMSQASAAFEALERIPASDVEEIQVLKGTEAFKYPYSANGVVNVVTKRGSGR